MSFLANIASPLPLIDAATAALKFVSRATWTRLIAPYLWPNDSRLGTWRHRAARLDAHYVRENDSCTATLHVGHKGKFGAGVLEAEELAKGLQFVAGTKNFA